MTKTRLDSKAKECPVTWHNFGIFEQHQHPKFESTFTHNQTNINLNLNSIKNTIIPIIIAAKMDN